MSGQIGGAIAGRGTSPLPVGDGSGSAALRMLKSETGTDDIELYSAGVHRATIRLNSSENVNIVLRDANGAAAFTFQFNTSNGQFVCPAEANIVGAINHDGSTAGFLGATPISRPTASGSRASNAALASLITALANLGLVTDGTSA